MLTLRPVLRVSITSEPTRPPAPLTPARRFADRREQSCCPSRAQCSISVDWRERSLVLRLRLYARGRWRNRLGAFRGADATRGRSIARAPTPPGPAKKGLTRRPRGRARAPRRRGRAGADRVWGDHLGAAHARRRARGPRLLRSARRHRPRRGARDVRCAPPSARAAALRREAGTEPRFEPLFA